MRGRIGRRERESHTRSDSQFYGPSSVTKREYDPANEERSKKKLQRRTEETTKKAQRRREKTREKERGETGLEREEATLAVAMEHAQPSTEFPPLRARVLSASWSVRESLYQSCVPFCVRHKSHSLGILYFVSYYLR